MDREMKEALALDGVKLEQMTGRDHGPMTLQDIIPDYYWGDEPVINCRWKEASLDDAARDAIERANGGSVFLGIDYSSDRLNEQALLRITGMISLGELDAAAISVANHVSLRQAAGESGPAFVKRITSAMLTAAVTI